MITKEEATKVAQEMIQLLPSKLSDAQPSSINLFLAMFLYDLTRLTEKSLGMTEALTFLDKHHRVVDLLAQQFSMRAMFGSQDEPR